MPDTWSNKCLAWAVVAASILLITACGDADLPDDPGSRAIGLRAEGRFEAAVGALRAAIRSNPDDAELRLLLAEVYLDLNNGALAAVALDQALDRGLAPMRAVLPRARALYAEGQFRELVELAKPAGLSVPDLVRVQYLQAEARAARMTSKDGLDDTVVQAYIELFDVIDSHPDDPDVTEVAALLSEARGQRLEVERAWQHYACVENAVETIGWTPSNPPSGRVLQVGPTRELKTIAAAARAATDGDVVEIDAGTYAGGVALWPQNRLLVRGIDGRPQITANGQGIEDRDVWLFTGDDVVVENVEISGARSRFENGSAIRHIGSGLTLRHVFLHDNENGVLSGNRHQDTNEILIEYSEFARNGDSRGFAHSIYIGRSKRFELRYSYTHASKGGHLVKSRAHENLIAYNRLTDGEDGTSSYIVDIPEGGPARILGNVIEQGAATINHGMISFAGEEVDEFENRLIVANNSFYNRDFRGIVVRNHADLNVLLVNNLLGGAPVAISDGSSELIANLARPHHGMNDPRGYDYSLVSGADAIDTGVDVELKPQKEYVHPLQWRSRQQVWRIDIGAYERCGL